MYLAVLAPIYQALYAKTHPSHSSYNSTTMENIPGMDFNMSHFTNNLAPVDIVPRPQSQPLFDTQVQSSPYQPTSQFHQPISQPMPSLGSNLAGYHDRMDPTMGMSVLASPDQINQRLAKYVLMVKL